MSSPLQPQRMKRYAAQEAGGFAPRQPGKVDAVRSAEEGLSNDIAAMVRVAMESRRSFVAERRMVATAGGVKTAAQVAATVAPATSQLTQESVVMDSPTPDLVLDGSIVVASTSAGMPDVPSQVETATEATDARAPESVTPLPSESESRSKRKKAVDGQQALDQQVVPVEEGLDEGSEADEVQALVHADEEEVDESKLYRDAMDACKIAMKNERSAPTSQAYKNRIAKFKRLSPDEFNELHRAYTDGDGDAFEMLVNHTLLLVVSATRKYLHRNLSFDDLVQEGNMGLMHGITKYNPDLGYHPSGYLMWWIKQRMGRAVDRNTGIIQVPGHVHSKVSKLHTNAQRALAAGDENAQQLAKESSEAYEELMRLKVAASMDQSMVAGDARDGELDLHDFFADDSADVETAIAHRQTMELLMDSLMALDERTRFIVAAKTDLLADRAHELKLVDWLRENDMYDFMSRYLDGSGYGRSVSQLGEALGRSGERVNQIFREAMKRITSEMAITAGGKENLSVDVSSYDADEAAKVTKRSSGKKGASKAANGADQPADDAERSSPDGVRPGI